MAKLDPECPDARVLRAIHEKRARIALGLDGSRLAQVVCEQRAAAEDAHLARCRRCQTFSRACPRCGREDAHSFFCRDNPARWRQLFRRRAKPQPPPRSPHEVLGVKRDVSPLELRRAYRALALRYHPDRCKEKGAAERMREINDAYAKLLQGSS